MDRIIKVGYLIDTISTETAGTEKQLLETIRRLERRRFEPMLMCLWESEWMRHNALPCMCLILGYQGFIKASFPRVVKRLGSLIRDYNIDIIHTFFEDSIFVALLTKIISRRPAVLLSSRRDIGLGAKNRPWYHSLYRLVLPFANRCFDGIIANSEQVSRYVSGKENVEQQKIKVIHNGIDIPDHHSGQSCVLEFDQENIWIGMVANLTPVKRHDVLLKAVSALHQRAPSLKFKASLLGSGPERQKLEELAKKLGIEALIHFEGAVKDVPFYLYNIDVGVLCSDREGLSNAILEYMGCGLPVVATGVGGNAELVDHQNGILIPPGDHLALADALEKLITKPHLRSQMGEVSLQKIKDNFSWKKTMTTLENYYISFFSHHS